jgi:hypothetical protein
VAIYDNVVNSHLRFEYGAVFEHVGRLFLRADSATRMTYFVFIINYLLHIIRLNIVLRCVNRMARTGTVGGACVRRRKRIQLQAFYDNVAAKRVIAGHASRILVVAPE